MLCPNCNYEIDNEAVCLNCGVDAVLFTKTCRMSDTLYNRGLSQAKGGELSNAIDSLVKSIEFNKNNITARNLLGLLYFQLCHVGEALKQWVISNSLVRENNLAAYYLQLMQDNSRTLENYNDAVKMYNNAIEYLYQKSDDMAIIQLKKAIEINPEFIDAMNLLTLCYLIQKDKEKAQSLVERVLFMDMNNSTALRYYKELFPAKIRPEPIQNIKRAYAQTQPFQSLLPKDKKSFGDTFHLTEIMSFVVGVVCAVAIIYFLVVPGAVGKKEEEIVKLKQAATTAQQVYTDTINADQARISELEAENVRLTKENEAYNRQASIADKTQKIQTASSLYAEGNDQDAAAILSAMDPSDLPADIADEANNLKLAVYPRAASQFHTEALQKYNTADYDQARTLLEKCLFYAQADASYMDSVIYYSGLLAEEAGNTEEAKEYFQRVVNEFPRSNLLTKANQRLQALTS